MFYVVKHSLLNHYWYNTSMAVVNSTYKYDISHRKSLKLDKFILGIAEKNSAAKKIAKALDPKCKKINFVVEKTDGVTKEKTNLPTIEDIYEAKYNGSKIIIVPASGHLYTLIQDGYGWQFPVYDFKWVSIPESIKNTDNYNIKSLHKTEAKIEIMRYLANLTKEHMIMTDYDEEGEVIGALILANVVNEKSIHKSKRMRFSSITQKEVQQSFKNTIEGPTPEFGIDFGMYFRGLMRHYLDWLWGINLSRALMLSLKNTTGRYYTLSTGRVQGPTLSFVSDREGERNTHVPVPRFKIDLSIKHESIYSLTFAQGDLEVEKDGKKIVSLIKGKPLMVEKVTKSKNKRLPNPPYNLSSLQDDAWTYFKFTGARAESAAEGLYLAGVISYPRTSSEKFPPQTDHKLLLSNLTELSEFKKTGTQILSMKGKLTPQEGKKTDKAHPCIHPTGELPKKLRGDENRLFSLIVYRYFGTFGKPSIIENSKAIFVTENYNFTYSGNRTLDLGWRKLVGKFDNTKEIEIPNFAPDQQYDIHRVKLLTKYTIASSKYNDRSLRKQMEKASIGTKATRANIIKNLLDRKFIRKPPGEITFDITHIGDTITDVLRTYSPQVISIELSRKLELMGDMIQDTVSQKIEDTKAFTLSDALVRGITLLHQMLEELMLNQNRIGELIDLNLTSQRSEETIIGDCVVCEDGKLKMIRSIATGKRFVGCSNYFNDEKCNVTYPLPQKGNLDLSAENCPDDNFPQVRVIAPKSRFFWCLNPDCKLMKEQFDAWEKQKQKKNSQKSKKKSSKSRRK